MEHHNKLELIYIISNPIQADENLYKIGRHTGGMKQLINRYTTAIPNLVVYFSHQVPKGSAKCVESLILEKLCRYRLMENARTEWFHVDLGIIISTILTVIANKTIVIMDMRPSFRQVTTIYLENKLKSSPKGKIDLHTLYAKFSQWYHLKYQRDIVNEVFLKQWMVILEEKYEIRKSNGNSCLINYSFV